MNKYISFCVPYYPWYREWDRSEELFKVLIPSMVKAGPNNFELSICDAGIVNVWQEYKTRPYPINDVYARLKREWPGRLVYTATDRAVTSAASDRPNRFWVAHAVNHAVWQSTSDYIFIQNIDIEIPTNFSEKYFEYVKENTFWVAKCYNIRRNFPRKHENGGWRSARGLVGMMKKTYYDVGGTDEKFIKDRHDSDLYARLFKKYTCIEDKCEGLFHIDHPGTNESTSEFKGTWPELPDGIGHLDLLLICAHADDEAIFFGGTLPYYRMVRGKRVGVICMTAKPDDTRGRELAEACKIYGMDIPPVCAGFRDVNERDIIDNHAYINLDRAWRAWEGKEPPKTFIRECILKYRPDVVITHSIDGEGYHSNHATTALSVIGGFADASTRDPHYKPKKLYLHSHKENAIHHDWRTACARLNGKSPWDYAVMGLQCHKSQHSPAVNPNCTEWGLYFTSVGFDTVDNDFFQNIPDTGKSK
jgi:LmbE family N-acetylglucosaminyl deacetylase